MPMPWHRALRAQDHRRDATTLLTVLGLTIAIGAIDVRSAGAGWIASMGGDGPDAATALVVTGGNAFLVGVIRDSVNGDDIGIRKYDAGGSLLWAYGYDGGAYDDDVPLAAVDDGAGGIVVTGGSRSFGAGTDCIVLHLNGSGGLMWLQRYHDWVDGRCRGNAIARMPNGDYVVGGSAFDSTSRGDALLLCYASDGTPKWQRRDDGGALDNDQVMAVAALSGGDMVCTGIAGAANSTGDYWTRRVNGATGGVQWEDRYDGPLSDEDWAVSIAVDASDRVFVTGLSVDQDSVADCTTLGTSAGGVRLWTARLHLPGWGFSQGSVVRIAPDGAVLVAGTAEPGGGNQDAVVARYTAASGTLSWVKMLVSGPGLSRDEATALDTDASGGIFVGTATDSTGTGAAYDVSTFVLEPTGDVRWLWHYAGSGNDIDYPVAVRATASGSVLIAGAHTRSGTGLDAFLTSVDSTTSLLAVDGDDARSPTPPRFTLAMSNPVRARLALEVTTSEATVFEIGVFDLLGRRVVKVSRRERIPAGPTTVTIPVDGLANGVYVVRLGALIGGSPRVVTGKFVRLR